MPFRMMTRERYLSDDELERLMAVVRVRCAVRHYAVIALLANTGWRPSEALALARRDLHLDCRPAWIRVRRLKKRKAVDQRDDVEISDRLAVILATHVEQLPNDGDARVFPMNRRSVQRLFQINAARAGLWRGHHLYTLRHTAATRMYVATRDLEMVQSMLGHEHRDTSCIYAHIPYGLLVDTVDSLPTCV
jgi:integrase